MLKFLSFLIVAFSYLVLATQDLQALNLTSLEIFNNGNLPKACQGKEGNKSPHLAWDDVPANTKSFAIINHDPDAAGGKSWCHWIVFNIPPTINRLKAGIKTLEGGATFGVNDYKKSRYDGGWPPQKTGPHRYIFTIYALDTKLTLKPKKATMQTLLAAMNGHILATATITTVFERK